MTSYALTILYKLDCEIFHFTFASYPRTLQVFSLVHECINQDLFSVAFAYVNVNLTYKDIQSQRETGYSCYSLFLS